jgi:hypothetical protein
MHRYSHPGLGNQHGASFPRRALEGNAKGVLLTEQNDALFSP